MTRAAVLREAGGAGIGQWAVLQAAAAAPAIELTPINSGEPAVVERAVAAFAREANSGLFVVVSLVGDGAPRADHRARGQASPACDLSLSLFRRRRRAQVRLRRP
jgi:hypothetical protein